MATITNPGIYIYTTQGVANANSKYVNKDGFLILYKFPNILTTSTDLINSALAKMLNTYGIVFDAFGNIWDANPSTTNTQPVWKNPFVSSEINTNLSFNDSWIDSKTIIENFVCANNKSSNPFYSVTLVPYPNYFVSSAAMPNSNYSGLDYFGGWLLEQINGGTPSASYQLLYNPMNRQELVNDSSVNILTQYQKYCDTVQFQDPICYCANYTKFLQQEDVVQSTGSKVVDADYCLYSSLDDKLASTSSSVGGRTLGQALINSYSNELDKNSGSFAANYQDLAGQCNCYGFCARMKSNLAQNSASLYDNIMNSLGPLKCDQLRDTSFTACLVDSKIQSGAQFDVSGNVNIINKCPTGGTTTPTGTTPNGTTPSGQSVDVKPQQNTLVDKLKAHKALIIGVTSAIIILIIIAVILL